MLSSTKFIEEGIMFKTNQKFDFHGVEISLMPVHQSEGYWLHIFQEVNNLESFVEEVSDELNIYVEGTSTIS